MVEEELPEKLLSLPIVELRADVKDNQIIEGDQGKFHYEITKVRVLQRSEIIIYSLSTSGPKRKRKKFVEQIIDILGKPFNTEQQFPDDPNFYTFWEAKKVEKRLRKISP
ncbi:hypothetical protein COU95_00200 [Candidatus Shapirobacteria bacterium CG10_big_fil_rev_8_21_14_0_10_40_9]|uniref:Uncharacterized protein n=1 Tax=Candidatus Shapirobacteria bacterium CG10_big_fil_rev_8_21_14_0_10_40_9 TaxID=1974888 RepID=A0A2M8L4E7_9BACT|nr:MAG: hypothetical protein COU95_00200 [Candidatus Shapirobacteria bacterium CG10_big_fil_rev_8_21_14_0_10_40_9]